MTWYNNGNWNSILVGDLKIIISQLCIAVNERERVLELDITEGFNIIEETEFTLPNGTTKSRPTPDDFASLVIEETNIIVTEIRSALNYLLNNNIYRISGLISFNNTVKLFYLNGSTYEQIITVNNVLAIGKYGPNWIPFDRAENVRIWLQIKELIENTFLTYALNKKSPIIDGEVQDFRTAISGPSGDPNPEARAQLFWTRIQGLPPIIAENDFSTRIQIEVKFRDTPGGAPPEPYIYDKGQITLDIDNFHGELIDNEIVFKVFFTGIRNPNTTRQAFIVLIDDLDTVIIPIRSLAIIGTENDPDQMLIKIKKENIWENISVSSKLEWSNLNDIIPFSTWRSTPMGAGEEYREHHGIRISLQEYGMGQIDFNDATRATVRLRQGTQEDIDNKTAEVLF